MSISTASMLVDLNISVWGANKVDRKATEEVVHNNAMATDGGRFQKNLMAGTTARKEIADYAAQCRLWHITRTLPWSDRGPRLLPVTMFLDYKAELNARKAQFDHMVANFLNDYASLVATAQTHLGALFNPNDYPPESEVASKFGFKIVFTPVPEAGDFRVDTGVAELQELKEQYDQAYDDRLNEAMRNAWGQLHTMLTNMSEKLIEPTGEKKKLFHETFITNAQDLCSLLTHLNITKDPKLEQARRELETVMFDYDIMDIRQDPPMREEMKGRLDKLLNSYDW